MNTTGDVVRRQLLGRRQRLEVASLSGGSDYLEGLLAEVDAALDRLDRGTFGLCEVCHEPIEDDRLLADPLVRLCIGDLDEGQRRALEHDLELAASVQAALLPPRDFLSDGWELAYHYRPLGLVSGDHCDIVLRPAPGGGMDLLFGDVAGKGVAASLLQGQLHALFRSLLATGRPLEEVLAHANRLFCESTLSTAYATLVAGRLDPDGTVELVNAGHLPPLLSRAGGIESLAATGLPFGLFGDGRFPPSRLELAPGDTLLLFTDGLSEALDGNSGEYGTARLATVLARSRGRSAGDTVRACLADLAGFTGGLPLTDDLTVMAIRRTAGDN